MQRVSLDRSNLPQAAVVASAYLVALGVLGLVAAYWLRAWFVPRPPPAQPVATEGSEAPAENLFGQVEGEGGSVTPGIAIRLLGLVAATPGYSGYAVMQLDSGDFVAVREGDEVSPGIRLVQVGVDFAIIERGGNRETLEWPATAPGGQSPEAPDEAAGSFS